MSEAAHSPVGLLLVDKPADARTSSARVVAAVKRRLIAAGAPKRIKVGHAGTLDPLASGLLVILVGRGATRLCAELMAGEKEYVARVDLSHASATDDYEGPLLANPPPVSEPTREDVDRVLAGFVGTIMQRPPAFSAMKIEGKRAYAEARRGGAIELAARPVVVHEARTVEYKYPMIDMFIRCGKGTYIRSMARDIGLALTGRAACLAALRRTAAGVYRVDHATRLDALPDRLTQADLLPVPSLKGPADEART